MDEATLVVHLSDHTFSFQRVCATWLTFPGWLRISRVSEDSNQVILEVSGGLFTARITARNLDGEWKIVLQGGHILASA